MATSNGQFKPGDSRSLHRGRPHFLNDPDNLKLVAALFASGATRDEMCEQCDVSDPGTITRWRKDPRVKAEVRKLLHDRIMRISAKTDSVIEQRLQNAADMTVDELIKIRKEFGGSALMRENVDEDGLLNEAMTALEENPELLDDMRALLRRAKSTEPEVEVPDDAAELAELE